MVDDPDIWRAANLLVTRYGRDAVPVALKRADEMLASGDPEGCVVWERIVRVVEELLRTSRTKSERLH